MKPLGPLAAKVVFILDYPTKQEIEKNYASGGYVGHYIERWLKDINSTTVFRDCYITHFLKDEELPGRLRKIDEKSFSKYVGIDKWNGYRRDIKEELSHLNPNVIFLVGEAALQGLTGEVTLDKYRGTIMSVDEELGLSNPGVKLFPIYHPRSIQMDFRRSHYTKADITKALKFKNDPYPYKSPIITWVARTAREVDDYFSRAENYVRKHGTAIANDIETYYNFITAMGYSYDGNEGVSIPLLDKKIGPEEAALINYKIASFHNDSGIGFFGQNYIYDCHHMSCHNYIDWGKFNVAGCTMELGKLIYPDLPASLAFYNSIYTNMPYFKDEGKEFNPTKTRKDQLYHYNAKDCISTHQVFYGQLKDAKEHGVYDFWDKKTKGYFHFYRKIDKRGILIDEEKRQQKIKEYEEKFEFHKLSMQLELGPNFNPLSPKQAQELLYHHLELPEKYKRSPQTGKQVLRTDETIIEWFILNLEVHPEHESLLNDLVLCRHYKKYMSYLNAIIHPDGRMRTHYKPSGTGSGRTSTNYSQDLFFYLEGKNVKRKNMGLPFQTIPKHGFTLPNGFTDGQDIREIFVPSPGYCFYGYDQSGAEARIVGRICNDEELLQRFASGEDVHSWTASFTLDKPVESVTKKERQDVGKKSRHAGNYDMQSDKYAEIAQLPVALAKKLLARFHEYSPNIRKVFHKEIIRNIRDKGVLVTHLGRKYVYCDRLDNPATWRQGFSYIPQSIVADNQKNGMMELESIVGEDVTNWQVEAHDGCMGETKIENIPRLYEEANKIMRRPIIMDSGSIIRMDPLVIPIEFEVSTTNMVEMKEYTQ